MVAEVMVTVGMAAARAAVVAALYNVLSADAPVGAPPEGNAKEVTRRRRRVTTTVSRNDDIMATGSLPAALLLPAAIISAAVVIGQPVVHGPIGLPMPFRNAEANVLDQVGLEDDADRMHIDIDCEQHTCSPITC